MSTEFYRKLDRAGSQRHNDVKNREKAVRLYCEFHGNNTENTYLLQIRGPQLTGSGYTEGKAFMIAGARLGTEDLKALRDACNALLKETT